MNKGKIKTPAWKNEVHDQQAWQPTFCGHSYQHEQQLQHKIYLCTTSTKTKKYLFQMLSFSKMSSKHH